MFWGIYTVPIAGFRWHEKAVVEGQAVVGPWLIADDSKGGKRYGTLGRSPKAATLVSQFELLGQDPSQEKIQRFANAYGSILHQPLYLGLSVGLKLADWQSEARAFLRLRQLWTLVVRLDDVGLIKAERDDAIAALSKVIRWKSAQEVVYDDGETEDPIANHSDRELLRQLSKGDVREPARFYVIRAVNRRLSGHVSPVIGYFTRASGRSADLLHLLPDSLLATIYLRFAAEIAGASSAISQCRHCRKPFFQGRRDQIYCGSQCRALYHHHLKARSKDA